MLCYLKFYLNNNSVEKRNNIQQVHFLSLLQEPDTKKQNQ